jgi:hypothetical protein
MSRPPAFICVFVALAILVAGMALGEDCASFRALMEGRFKNGVPIRLVLESLTTGPKVENYSQTAQTRNLNYYEFDPNEPDTWRFDNLMVDQGGRGGGLTCIVSKKGAEISCNVPVDDAEMTQYLNAPFEPMHAKRPASVGTELGQATFGPSYLKRWFGMTLVGLPADQFFTKFPQCKLSFEKGLDDNMLNILRIEAPSYKGTYDINTGVMMSYSLCDNPEGRNPWEVVKASGVPWVAESILFGVAERLVVEQRRPDGAMEMTEVTLNVKRSRMLTREEFEARLNPEFPRGAWLTNYGTGQSTRVTAEDLPLRLWDYRQMFSPERKAKGLINEMKAPQK